MLARNSGYEKPGRSARSAGPDRRPHSSMTTTLPKPGGPPKLTTPCAGCGRGVIRCRSAAGDAVILEWCTPGAKSGTYTITAGLFDGIEPTATPSKGAGFRIHRCPTAIPERSHSAASFEGKRAVSYGVAAYKRLRGGG